MGKVLTIVIPSYNTEQYISECLPCFLDQSILDDIEILIVDDGSTDNTGGIADVFQKKYPRTIRAIHQENGGHGAGINCGISNATGKYFKVVDGDDWVDTENLVALVNYLKTSDADIDLIINPFWQYHIIKEKMSLKYCGISRYNTIYNFDDVSQELSLLGMHGITIKTSILRDNHIFMTEKCFYDDSEYDIYPVPYINTLVCLKEPVYIYRIGGSTQSINIKNVIKNIDMHKKIVTNLIRFYQMLPSDISAEKKNYIKRFVISRINSQYMIYLRAKISKNAKSEIYKFDNYLKQLSPELYKQAGALQIKLLRTNAWPCYISMYLAFKFVRMLRGF